MRTPFSGFYRPTDADFSALWENAIFVLDANVLLNLYRYPISASKELLGVLSHMIDRVWIPYHVGLEFHRNRLKVVAEQKARFREVRSILNSMTNRLEADLGKLQLKKRHSTIDPDSMLAKVKGVVADFERELTDAEASQFGVAGDDPVLEQLTHLLEGRVGPPPQTQQDLDRMFSEGADRYSAEVPPGYMDESDKDKDTFGYGGLRYTAKYGDLLVWKQIIAKAKADKLENMILLTDDAKEDWWWIVSSEGKKTVGPRPELLEEINREAGVLRFYMYSSEQFLIRARDHLRAEVTDESIAQIRDVSEMSRRRRGGAYAIRGFQAQFAVYHWLVSVYGNENVELENGLADICVSSGAEGIVGYEVLTVRDSRHFLIRIRQRMEHYSDWKETGLSQLNIVLVVEDATLREEILRRWQVAVDRVEGLSDFGMMIGTLVKDDRSDIGVRFSVLDSGLNTEGA